MLCDAKQRDTWVTEKRLIVFSLQATSPNLPTVDIIVRPAVPFDAMYRNRIEKDVGGVRLNLASIEDLIALKTGTGRKQDAPDIEALKIVARVTGQGKGTQYWNALISQHVMRRQCRFEIKVSQY